MNPSKTEGKSRTAKSIRQKILKWDRQSFIFKPMNKVSQTSDMNFKTESTYYMQKETLLSNNEDVRKQRHAGKLEKLDERNKFAKSLIANQLEFSGAAC